jgi:signal transduction histidine kinase
MARFPSPNVVRIASSWGLVAALVLLAGIGVAQAWRIHSRMDAEERERIEGELLRLVRDIDLDVSLQAREWLTELGEVPASQSPQQLQAREQALRESTPSFEAFYLWDPIAGSRLNAPPANSRAATFLVQAQATLIAARAEMEDDPDRAVKLLTDTVERAFLQLDGSDATEILPFLQEELLPSLEAAAPAHVQARANAREQVARLERRGAGYHLVQSGLSQDLPLLGHVPAFFYGRLGEPDYMLAAVDIPGNSRQAAVQLDQRIILKELLHRAGDAERYLLVRHAILNQRVAGSRTSEPVIVEVPFLEVLPHLRLGCQEGLLFKRRAEHQWVLLWQMVPILIAVLLGAIALAARLAADKREQDLLRRQQEFVTRVTHELKTPLAGIRLMAETLEMGSLDSAAETQRHAQRIISETDRLNLRVEEILQVARVDQPMERGEVDLYQMLHDLAEAWGPRFEDTSIVFHSELQEVPSFLGDEKALRDAVACLLDNALKFRDPAKKQARIWLQLTRWHNLARIQVADNGLGVPVERRMEVFHRFARVEGDGRGKAGGHGLGLDFAQRAVTEHKGTIECVDGVDGGACFKIGLPLPRSFRKRT